MTTNVSDVNVEQKSSTSLVNGLPKEQIWPIITTYGDSINSRNVEFVVRGVMFLDEDDIKGNVSPMARADSTRQTYKAPFRVLPNFHDSSQEVKRLMTS